MDYVLVIHKAEEGGYWAEVPALPGCFAQGESLEDLLNEAREAILSHLESLKEDGHAPPLEPVIIATVRTEQPAGA